MDEKWEARLGVSATRHWMKPQQQARVGQTRCRARVRLTASERFEALLREAATVDGRQLKLEAPRRGTDRRHT